MLELAVNRVVVWEMKRGKYEAAGDTLFSLLLSDTGHTEQPLLVSVARTDMRCGWWRVTDTAVLQLLVENLHTRGTREKDLRRNITKLCLDQNWTAMLKVCYFFLYHTHPMISDYCIFGVSEWNTFSMFWHKLKTAGSLLTFAR